ncbi:MAG TPA: lytic transglycosylase domain-containing protein [Vicinamibacteria bacterium]
MRAALRSLACSGLCLAPLFVTSATGQIYTRKNANGVVEATNVPDANDYRLTYPGKGTLIHSQAYRLRPSYNGEFNHHIEAAARLHGVEVALVRAVIQVESDFDHLAVSSKGARGLMQLMPDTARILGVANPFDPRQNIFGGVRYLRQLLDQFRGDVALALAGFNAGPNAVLRYNGVPPYRETRMYVAKIESLLGRGGVPAGLGKPVVAAAFFAPNPGVFQQPAQLSRRATAAPRPAGPLSPARPRVFYKWKDSDGGFHVTQAAPGEGTPYTMIRALD